MNFFSSRLASAAERLASSAEDISTGNSQSGLRLAGGARLADGQVVVAGGGGGGARHGQARFGHARVLGRQALDDHQGRLVVRVARQQAVDFAKTRR